MFCRDNASQVFEFLHGFELLPIIGMTNDEVREHLRFSEVFIDKQKQYLVENFI